MITSIIPIAELVQKAEQIGHDAVSGYVSLDYDTQMQFKGQLWAVDKTDIHQPLYRAAYHHGVIKAMLEATK